MTHITNTAVNIAVLGLLYITIGFWPTLGLLAVVGGGLELLWWRVGKEEHTIQ